jgi:hypothetical protein
MSALEVVKDRYFEADTRSSRNCAFGESLPPAKLSLEISNMKDALKQQPSSGGLE